MEILENKLIYAVLTKDRSKIQEISDQIFTSIYSEGHSFEYFKTYIIQFNGIFYWNTVKNIEDTDYIQTILNERNNYLIKIQNCHSKSELKRIFEEMLDYYTASQNQIIYNCSNQLIKSILIYIYNNSNKKITLDLLSNKFHISKSYLSNLISKHASTSLPSIILDFRMEKAMALLMDSNLSINEISYLSGFESTSYFCHQFKSKYNITPKQYRVNGNL